MAAFAVSFIPRRQFFAVLDANNQPTIVASPLQLLVTLGNAARVANLDPPRLTVSMRGNFVFAPDANGQYTELGVLDGDNVGGRVGEPPPAARLPPIQGGKNPSGNLTQGGLFESWFFLTVSDIWGGGGASTTLPTFGPSLLGLERSPPTINFSTAAEIAAAAEVSNAVAHRIVEARAQAPFTTVDDLRTRARISGPALSKIRDRVLFL
jgi:Helix-hairpin-helix motif